MPNSAADHTTHDELLIARLYGDDVDDRERARALELVAGCDECSALYADLGAIAEATSVLPARPRPRDFALTEQDAARLRPRRGVRARFLAIGRRRSFGGALVALGFSGLVLTSALSMLGPAQPTQMSTDARLAAAPAAGVASSNAYSQGGVAIPEPAATPAPNKAIASTAPTVSGIPGGEVASSAPAPSPPVLAPQPSTALDQTTPTEAPALAAGGTAGEPTPGAPPVQPRIAATPQSATDSMPLFLVGSALVLVLGLAVLLVPVVLRRSRGRARR
ncbi:MAG TPA: hypothetical protein VF349_03500 [Candidatus Limnocylindrales bacterium]